jgi:hypothetical protein
MKHYIPTGNQKFLPVGILSFFFLCIISLDAVEKGELLKKYEKRVQIFQLAKHSPSSLELAQNESSLLAQDPENSEKLSSVISSYQKGCFQSLPPLISAERQKTKEALESAEESFAESLAVEYYTRAVDLYSEGEVLSAGLSSRLEEIEIETIASKREELIESLFDDIESGISKWEESIDISSKAMSLSLSQASALHYSQSDLSETLDLIRKYRSSEKQDSVNLAVLEKDIQEGLSLINLGKIKRGFLQLEELRKKLSDLVTDEFREYAKNKLDTSLSMLSTAEEILVSQKHKFDEDPEILAQLEDNLRAARESYSLAEQLYKDEKFVESIASAEDSLFLTERFQEDVRVATVPEKRIYADEPNQAHKRQYFKGLTFPKAHKVKKGESLVSISEFYFHSHKKWKEIFKQNKKSIKNPNTIFPSQSILLPSK